MLPSNQKGFAPIFLILGLVFVLLVGGGIYYQSRLQSQLFVDKHEPPTIPSMADQTANWETYTNSKHNFSFKYPQFDKIYEAGNDFFLEPNPGVTSNAISLFQVRDYQSGLYDSRFSHFSNLNDYAIQVLKDKCDNHTPGINLSTVCDKVSKQTTFTSQSGTEIHEVYLNETSTNYDNKVKTFEFGPLFFISKELKNSGKVIFVFPGSRAEPPFYSS